MDWFSKEKGIFGIKVKPLTFILIILIVIFFGIKNYF